MKSGSITVGILLGACLLLQNCGVTESESSADLVGTWIKRDPPLSENPSIHSALEIALFPSQEFEMTGKFFHVPTGILLGYTFVVDGRYTIASDSLTMTTEKQAILENIDSSYSTEKPTPLPITPESVTVVYAIDGNRLTLTYPPCGPTENCVGTLTFERKK